MPMSRSMEMEHDTLVNHLDAYGLGDTYKRMTKIVSVSEELMDDIMSTAGSFESWKDHIKSSMVRNVSESLVENITFFQTNELPTPGIKHMIVHADFIILTPEQLFKLIFK